MRTIINAHVLVTTLAACLPLWVTSAPITRANEYVDQYVDQYAEQYVVDMVVEPALASGIDDFGVALDLNQLELYRGGSDTVFNDMKLSGIVSDNSAINVVTGSNSIGEASFSNASGLPIVIQNSGANVLIQNATIINVQIK